MSEAIKNNDAPRHEVGKTLIDIRAVTKSYFSGGVETKVLFGIDLQVPQGDFLAVMGQSGSGKSTLMNILGCLDQASTGTYQLNGVNTLSLSRSALATIRNRTIGFVFQSFNLIKRMSVAENVALPLIYAGSSRDKANKKALIELERVGLKDYAKRLPNQLSGGQQQRVAIARALVADPPLILADEPTGNLDSKSGNEVMELLTDLHASGSTILMVTHSDYDASFSQKTILMKDGMILSEKKNHRNVDVLVNSNN